LNYYHVIIILKQFLSEDWYQNGALGILLSYYYYKNIPLRIFMLKYCYQTIALNIALILMLSKYCYQNNAIKPLLSEYYYHNSDIRLLLKEYKPVLSPLLVTPHQWLLQTLFNPQWSLTIILLIILYTETLSQISKHQLWG